MTHLTLRSGLRALNKKQYQDVHVHCLGMIKANINDPIPYFLLAVLAYDHKNFQKAEELFLRAEGLDPSEPHFPTFLGRLYSGIKRSEDAINAANRASNHAINNGYLADILGVIYSRANDHKRAIELFKNAVKLDETQPNFFYNLGASQQFIGNFEAARTAFSKAAELDKNHYGAWTSLVGLDRQTKTNNNLEHLQNLYNQLVSNEDAKHQLGHAIAKTLEDLDRHEESLDWLERAKTEKRKNYRYDRITGKAVFNAARQTTAAKSNGFNSKATPIFIVGLPRTGTTLVDRILSSHSKIRSAGELNFFADIIKSSTQTASNLVLDSETFKASNNIDLNLVGQKYMQRLNSRMDQASYIIDKMPFNFFYAALISKALPNARLIALRRGAMDSCLSNYRQLLSVKESFYNYTYDLGDTAFFYKEFDSLISHWRDHLPQTQFMEVRYEDIVFDQENQTRKLLGFCGLEFEGACMNFHQNNAPVSTASSVQVRKPLYSGSIGRWKKYGAKLDGLRASLGKLAEDQ
ncbi:MAG: sulfotransferase [Maricaulaceae bacterium]